MKYGISLKQIPRQVYDRVIIPGLAPSQIMAAVSLGMSRPQWIKFIISSIANNKLDITQSYDRYKLIFDEKSGLLLQAFLWKRATYELGTKPSGYGMGFIQMQSSGTLAVLSEGVTADRLCTSIVNDLMQLLKEGTVKKCTRYFRRCFNPKPNYERSFERLNALKHKSEKEKKRGILSSFVWAIDESLNEKYESLEKKSRAFTIPTLFLRIVEDIGVTDPSKVSKSLYVLCLDKPGKMSTELSREEIAVIIHELLKGKRSQVVVLSFLVFDLIRKNYPISELEDIDLILCEANISLPDDSKILKYLKKIYHRLSYLLSKYVSPSELISYAEFLQICGPEKIRKIAVLWEYNLIVGELEEMLRDFIKEEVSTPYEFSFLEKWNKLVDDNSEYWREVMERFDELTTLVVYNEEYLSAFVVNNEYLLNLPDWFTTIFAEFEEIKDFSDKLKVLLRMAELLGDAITFDGETVNVLKRPEAINPLIARGAFYEWLRTFVGLWK